MSALYGFIPNAVQQQTPSKPVDPTHIATQKVEMKPETAPKIVNKVAPAFEQDATAKANEDAARNREKQANANRTMMAAAKDTASPAPSNLAAESKLAAQTPDKPQKLSPEDLAKHRAEDLAKAREQAIQYREYKERIDRAAESNAAAVDQDGNPAPRLDVRIPLPDEMPDRPVPRLGVPTV